MVFFTCNGCGESLKKVQVDKHVAMCRSCTVLSCVDCGTDFWGDDYKTHTKCISEDQKYGGKGYEAKANKGDVKQQQWLQRVHEAMNKPGVSAKLKDVLRQVSAYDNIPRKKAKFQNWMKNSLRIINPKLHDEVWEVIAAADKAQAPEAPQETTQAKQTEDVTDTNGNGQQNGHTDSEKSPNKAKISAENMVVEEPEESQSAKKKKKDKKRKYNSEEEQAKEENVNGEVNEASSKKKKKSDQLTEETQETQDQHDSKGTFNWKDTIKAVLSESPDQELPLKKLRKKVLAAYSSFAGDANCETEMDVVALFHKKLDKNPEFRIRLVN